MKITKVTYQKAYIIGPYLQEKVGFEAELTAPYLDANIEYHIESPEEILSHLRKLADDWHMANNPHLQDQSITGSQPAPIIDLEFERLEAKIDNCQTLSDLDKLRENHRFSPLPGKIIAQFAEKRKQFVS